MTKYLKNVKNEKCPLKEIAQVMELSEPRISQIHTRAIQKLRTYMENYLGDEPELKPKRKRG